jgi:hypothetical protein
MVIGQNVGIGTANPNTKLHIEANGAADGIRIDNVASNGDPVIVYSVNGTSRISMGIDDSDADKFKIGTTAITTSTRMTIMTNGYVGFGTTSPDYHLHLVQNRAANYVATFENTNVTGAGIGSYVISTHNAVGGISENPSGLGVYGVHLPATGAGLGVWGTSNSSDANGVQGSIPTTGSWRGYGGLFIGGLGYANGLYNLSDGRMKGEIRQLDNSLDKLMQIRGVSYKYNSEQYNQLLPADDRTYIGLIAQEVAEIFPEATAEKYLPGRGSQAAEKTADMGEVQREVVTVVDYTALIPVLIESIKEQQAEIEKLKARISELEN